MHLCLFPIVGVILNKVHFGVTNSVNNTPLIISYTFVYVRQLIETLELSTLFFSYQQQLSAKNLVFCTQEGDWRQIFLQTKDKLFSTLHRTAPSFTLQG